MKGYLTYSLAGVAIAWGIIGYLFTWIDGATALNTIWIGLSVFGLRRAVG